MEFKSADSGIVVSIEPVDGGVGIGVTKNGEFDGMKFDSHAATLAAAALLGPPPDDEAVEVEHLSTRFVPEDLQRHMRRYAAAYAMATAVPETLPADVEERWQGVSRDDAIRVAESLKVQLAEATK